MKRSTMLLLLGCTFLAFGYTRDHTGAFVSKIYLHNDLLIRTTPGVDIRFYNLSTPSSVRETGTLQIEGNSDVATYQTFMYADQGHDLVVYDISNPEAARPLDTIPDVFFRSGAEIAEILNGSAIRGNEFGGTSGCGANGCEVNDESVDPDFNDSWSGDSWDDTWSSGSISGQNGYHPLNYSNGSIGMTMANGAAPTGSSSNATSSSRLAISCNS